MHPTTCTGPNATNGRTWPALSTSRIRDAHATAPCTYTPSIMSLGRMPAPVPVAPDSTLTHEYVHESPSIDPSPRSPLPYSWQESSDTRSTATEPLTEMCPTEGASVTLSPRACTIPSRLHPIACTSDSSRERTSEMKSTNAHRLYGNQHRHQNPPQAPLDESVVSGSSGVHALHPRTPLRSPLPDQPPLPPPRSTSPVGETRPCKNFLLLDLT